MGFLYHADSNSFTGDSHNEFELGQVMWHVTNQCNLDCAICFTKKMRKNVNLFLKKDDIPNYIYILKQLGVQKIDISGGEPLLYPYLRDLVNACAQNNIFITVTTSGVGLTENVEWLVHQQHLFSRIILSIDGNEALHNRLRGSEKAFSTCIGVIEKLKKNNCKTIRINTVVTVPLLDELERNALCNCIKRISPREWCLIQPYSINKTNKCDSLAIPDAVFESFVNKCDADFLQSNIVIEKRANSDYKSYWAIYCDGFLYYSENRSNYNIKIKLTYENVNKIKRCVFRHPQTYIALSDKGISEK